jgi:WD40 repeat protein
VSYSDGSIFELVIEQPAEGEKEGRCLIEPVQLKCHGAGRMHARRLARAARPRGCSLHTSAHPRPSLAGLCCALAAGEVWGLATAPESERFASVSEDRTLRLWDARTRRELASRSFDTPLRAVAFSPDGTQLAVSLGTEENREEDKAGFIVVLDGETLEVQHGPHQVSIECDKCVLDLKWSPDGSLLAAAAADGNTYVLKAQHGYAEHCALTGHAAPVRQVDWSKDGATLQTACAGFDLLQFDVESGRPLADGERVPEEAMWSWTSPVGWPVAGVWPPYSDGVETVAVERSPGAQLLAAGDVFGRVKLLRYPAAKGAGFRIAAGHSSRTTICRWGSNGRTVFSAGDRDGAVLQWDVVAVSAILD